MRYLIVLLLAGCAAHFDKPGGTAEGFNRDLYACKRDAAPAVGNKPIYDRMIDECLALNGWREQ